MELDDGPDGLTMSKKTSAPATPPSPSLKPASAAAHEGPYVLNTDGASTISIINRGEQLLYQDANGELVLEISIPGKWVDIDSMKKWDGLGGVSEEQRTVIAQRIADYFEEKQGYAVDLIFGNSSAGAKK
jgi:hypothetical protein